MGFTEEQDLLHWIAQRNVYEEKSWEVFKRIRLAENPYLLGHALLTWKWNFTGITEYGVSFYYNDGYGTTEDLEFPYKLLYDKEALEAHIKNIEDEKRVKKEKEQRLQEKQDLATLEILKRKYEPNDML